jgi:hypothetical protein
MPIPKPVFFVLAGVAALVLVGLLIWKVIA